MNDELTAAANALVPGMNAIDEQGREAAFSAQYLRSRDNHERFFRRIGIAVPNADEDVQLLLLDFNTARYFPPPGPPNGTACATGCFGTATAVRP